MFSRTSWHGTRAVRNGYHEPREVLTSAGAVAVHAPRINDRRADPDTGERQRFTSAIPPTCYATAPGVGCTAALAQRRAGR